MNNNITSPSKKQINLSQLLNPPQMGSINFLYWLHGYMELSNKKSLSKVQVEIVLAHIKLVKDNVALTNWIAGFLTSQVSGVKGKKYEILKSKIDENFTNLSQFNLPDFGIEPNHPWDPKWISNQIIC